MAILVSLAPFEQVFSARGDIVTKKRNCIIGENVKYLLYLRNWGIILEDNNFNNYKEDKRNKEDKVRQDAIVIL